MTATSLRVWSSDQLKKVISMRLRRKIAWQRVAMRQFTGRFRMLPNLLIIGGQRCGTSSVYKYLGQHPEVEPSIRKEVRYFTAFADKSEDWYRAHFPLAGPLGGHPKICFEATPDYLLDPRCADRAAAMLGTARIVALLRDPVERAFSHYQHNRRLGLERMSFDEALESEQSRLSGSVALLDSQPTIPLPMEYRRYSYVTRGLYAEQLARWTERFAREQILILASEDLFRDPAGALASLTSFLGIRAWAPTTFKNYSYVGTSGRTSAREVMSPETRAWLSERFREPNERLYELVGHRFPW